MNNTEQHFLHNKKTGCTTCFTPMSDGTVWVRWQQTLDPNEELNEETYTKEEAREVWKKEWSEGARKARSWHTCKRDSAWANNGDD